MTTTVSIRTIFPCSLERAFKTPMLCDVSKVHTGYGIMPRVTHCTDDEHWGTPGSSKKVFVAASATQKGGFASVDNVLEREENVYWKIEVNNFQTWMLGFSRFVGEWRTTELAPNQIQVDYTYTMHSDVTALQPLNWLFAHMFWKTYMGRVAENIKQMAINGEPYRYA